MLPALLHNATLHSLHGHLQPTARTRSLAAFASSGGSGGVHVLLATDVAARGLDLPAVDAVIQVDAPADPRAFAHRCGRTARAGAAGTAWTLLCGRETGYAEFMAVRKVPLRRRPRFGPGGAPVDEGEGEEDEDAREEDPEVEPALQRIRALLLADRALHDKVGHAPYRARMSLTRARRRPRRSYPPCARTASTRPRISSASATSTSSGSRARSGSSVSRACPSSPRGPPRTARVGRTRPSTCVLRPATSPLLLTPRGQWDTFAYADAAQEAKRAADRAAAAQTRAEGAVQAQARRERKKANEAWSVQDDRRTARDVRKDKKVRKRKWERAQAQAEAQPGTAAAAQGDGTAQAQADGGADGADDWAEMAREERAAKKVRTGAVGQPEFDADFADL
jgi:ATP-dependent RNA helicase DDX55/SPB4